MASAVPQAARALLLAALAAALVIAPGDAAGPTGAQQDELTIGAILDLSDGWTSLGRGSRVTLQLAAADANADLARRGSSLRVRLRIVDAKGDPAVALRELRRLAAAGIRVFVGPPSSSEVKALRAAATRLGVVVISQGSTAHSLAVAGDNVLRFVPDDLREGEALVALLRRDRIDGLVPVWRRDPGNAGLARSVRRQFPGRGRRMSSGVSYATDATTFAAVANFTARQVTALRNRGARRVGVYLAAFDEVVDLFNAARSNPILAAIPWYGSDGVALTTRLLNSRSAATFADAVGYPNPTVGISDTLVRRAGPLLARARKRLGRNPDALALGAYDALRIVVEATERAGEVRGAALRRAVVAAANAHVGATGRMTLNAAGDRAFGNFDFWAVCRRGAGFEWVRAYQYAASRVGAGRIIAGRRC